jgi:hypothetical protein
MKTLDYKLDLISRSICSSEIMSTSGLSLKRHFEKSSPVLIITCA